MKPNALKENLREQTIIIEDCTAELKSLINKRVFDGTTFANYVKEADKLIDKALKEMSDDGLKRMALERLKLFARKEFNRLRSVLIIKPSFSFVALGLVLAIFNNEEVWKKERAYRKLQRIEPTLAPEPPNFTQGLGTRSFANMGMPMRRYMKDYMDIVNETSAFLAKDRAKDEGGLSLRLSSEIYVRNKWQEDNLQQLKSSGKRLVWISSHVNCSERCQAYQGRLYSLDGTKGRTADGHNYVPIEVATERYETTKSGHRWRNGTLTGFNCRHYTIDYEENGVTPLTYDDRAVEKARAIETKQRELERKVYHEREQYYANRDTNKKKALYFYHKAADSRKEYIDFCVSHNVAYYPDRIQVKPM